MLRKSQHSCDDRHRKVSYRHDAPKYPQELQARYDVPHGYQTDGQMNEGRPVNPTEFVARDWHYTSLNNERDRTAMNKTKIYA